MKILHILPVAVLGAAFSTSALSDNLADCGCDVFAGQGLFSTKTNISESDRKSAEFKFFCSAEYSAVKQAVDRYWGLGVSIPDFLDLNLASDMTEDKLSIWRKEQCKITDIKKAKHDMTIAIEKIASPEIVDGINKCFSICKSSGGLFCETSTIDELNSSYFIRWTPTSNDTTPPKVVSARISGGKIASSGGVGEEKPIFKGMEILPLGHLVPLVRNEPTSELVMIVNTTEGPCQSGASALNTEYIVSAQVYGDASKDVSIEDSFRMTYPAKDSCGADDWYTEVQCLGKGKINSYKTATHSVNCDSGVREVKKNTPSADCVTIKSRVHGCGWDKPFNTCAGRGWLDFTMTVYGAATELSSLPEVKFNKDLTLAKGEEGSVTFQYPKSSLGKAKNPNYRYIVEITRVRAKRKLPPISFSNDNPNGQGVETSISSAGVLTIKMKSE